MGEILVTGGAGFIGTHTCIALLQAGYSVVILDNLCNAKQESLLHLQEITGKSIPFYHMDIRNADGLRQIFQTHHISAVLHFAGLKAVGESVQQPLRYYQNNIGGMMTLLEELQKTDCRTLIFSSSATVYGTHHTAPYAETVTPLSASNPYGETKIISEQLLQDLCQADSDWHITALRYFNPIGAHESGLLGEEPHGIPSNIAPYLALVASGQLPYFRVYGNDYDTPDGTGVRDYVHVMDLAEGHVSALQYSMQHTGFSVFNLGTGSGCSVLELANMYEACRRCGNIVCRCIQSQNRAGMDGETQPSANVCGQLAVYSKTSSERSGFQMINNIHYEEALNNILIVVIAEAVVLVLVMLLGSKKSRFRKKLSAFFADDTVGTAKHPMEFNREYYITGEKNMRKPAKTKGATRTEMVMLVQKVDERRRTIDPNGTSKLYNEYYELIFKTRKGDILHIVTTKVVYKEVPFNQQGSLTFRGEQFVKFKYLGGEITEAKTHYNAEVINK